MSQPSNVDDLAHLPGTSSGASTVSVELPGAIGQNWPIEVLKNLGRARWPSPGPRNGRYLRSCHAWWRSRCACSPLFEKYSEDALRSLFYARHAVSEHGGAEILPEHVVLGVLIGAPATIQRFAANLESAESLRARLVAHVCEVEKLATGVEIPFAEPTREALLQSAIEADEWQGGHIEPEHLLLGVLVKTSGVAADALLEAGVAIVGIRQFLQIPPQG